MSLRFGKSVWVFISLFILLFQSCSLEDDRDLCCYYSAVMRYSYLPYKVEAFPEYIFSLRHFLFAYHGEFLGELPPGDDLQTQPLNLPPGDYTMVTIGNYQDATLTNHDSSPHISEFTLLHNSAYVPTEYPDNSLLKKGSDSAPIFGNAEELYWGVRHFSINEQGLASEIDFGRTYTSIRPMVTTMNNIHCHLKVKVKWANVPEYRGVHEIELSGVPASYSLSPVESLQAGEFIVPSHRSLATHKITVPMREHELEGEFVTLRYTDQEIPTLRLYYKGIQVGPDIDLKRAFKEWGWHPSRIHVQKYTVLITLYGNGSADLSPSLNATIEDWIDGGTFG